jgi:hypothetical protein
MSRSGSALPPDVSGKPQGTNNFLKSDSEIQGLLTALHKKSFSASPR